MAEFKTNDDMFGRYVRIQTDFSKALHIYKVVSQFESNTYCDIPILVSSKEVKHEQVVPVLNVIHFGIDESKVIRVALNDCEMVPTNTVGPAADVAPVRHGKWKERTISAYRGMDDFGDPIYRDVSIYCCSNCDRETVVKERYCPNCGAKMILGG